MIRKILGWSVVGVAILVLVAIALPTYKDFRFVGPPSQKEFADGKNWLLMEDVPYYAGQTQEHVVVPAGFVHDGASIPRSLHSALSKQGRYSRPAMVHDYLYWSQVCTRAQADNLLLIAMKETAVSKADRWLIYKSVRLGGGKAWKDNAADRQSGMPRVIPAEYRKLPNDDTWPQYRAHLFSQGVRDPPMVGPSPGFCAQGDATHVPTGELAAQTEKELRDVMAEP